MIKPIVHSVLLFNFLLTAMCYEIDYNSSKGEILITGLDSREFSSLASCFAKVKPTRPVVNNKMANNRTQNRQPVVRPLTRPKNVKTTTASPTELPGLVDVKLPEIPTLSNEQQIFNEVSELAQKIIETNEVPINSEQQEAKRSQDQSEFLEDLLDFLGLKNVESLKRAMLRDKGSMIYVGKKDRD
jgi:hypothetical protein